MPNRKTAAPKPCRRCGELFGRRQNEDHYRFVARVYCGRECSDPGRGEVFNETAKERFQSFIMPEPNSGCWIWLGSVTRGGYGTFAYQGRSWRAPRFAYHAFKGAIPSGLLVRHTCDTPACVNPDHLILGNKRDNAQDAIDRGRIAAGERNGRARITAEQAVAIFHDARQQSLIADDLGLSRASVCLIKQGKHWGSVTGAEINTTGDCPMFTPRREAKKHG